MAQLSLRRSVQASEAAGRRRGRQLHPARLLQAASLLLAVVHLGLRGLSFVGNVPMLRQLRLRSQAIVDEGGEMFERFEKDKIPAKTPAKKKEEPQEEDMQWFVGNIKSYSTSKGFGFIECNETFSEHQVDVFLHKTQVNFFLGGRAYEGDKVRFSLEMNKQGKPQARNVEALSDAATVAPSKNFVGRVKGYDPDKGFGFIGCEETHNIFKSDIFLHKVQADSAGLEKGNLVTFSVEVSKRGQPQARNVERFAPSSFAEGNQEQEASAAPLEAINEQQTAS